MMIAVPPACGPRESMTSARIRMNIRAARMTMAPSASPIDKLVASSRPRSGMVPVSSLYCCSRSPVKRKNAKLMPGDHRGEQDGEDQGGRQRAAPVDVGHTGVEVQQKQRVGAEDQHAGPGAGPWGAAGAGTSPGRCRPRSAHAACPGRWLSRRRIRTPPSGWATRCVVLVPGAGAQTGLLGSQAVGLPGQRAQDALSLAEHAVTGRFTEAADDVLGVAGCTGRPGSADEEVLDGQRKDRGRPRNPAAPHYPVKDAPQPGRRALLFWMGDGGQARPDVDGLLAIGAGIAHDSSPRVDIQEVTAAGDRTITTRRSCAHVASSSWPWMRQAPRSCRQCRGR